MQNNLNVPRAAFAITLSDSVNFHTPIRAIYVGVGGNIVCYLPDGTTVTFVAVPQGTELRIECLRVNSTGTTAASLVGLV